MLGKGYLCHQETEELSQNLLYLLRNLIAGKVTILFHAFRIMQQDILDYLKTQRICVLSVEMMDGSPHAATVHFAHSENPFLLMFQTERQYRKSEPLYGREKSRASVVVGVNESDMKTLQMDGEVRLLREDEMEIFKEIYLTKFPKKIKSSSEPNAVMFGFFPTWWRFTDWTRPEGKKILTSEDKN